MGTLLAGGPAGRVDALAAGQYGYVPLGRHLVLIVEPQYRVVLLLCVVGRAITDVGRRS